MSKSRQISSNLILAVGIFAVLCAVYLLSYSGVFHSGDEIFYVLNAMDFVQGDAASIGKGGPYVLVIGLVTRVMEVLGFDARLQILFLINVPITALTAVFLFLLAIELGYGARIAVLVALLFGLTTPAWVYSKALFREPWAALGLAAALFFVIRFRRRRVVWDLVLGLLSLAVAVTTRVSTAVVLPFFLVYVGAVIRNSTTGHRALSWPPKLALLLLLSALTAIGLWLAIDAYHPLATRLFQAFTDLQPLAGILISPGRGLFIYAPLLLLAVASLGLFYRQHPGETLVISGSVAAYILILVAWPKWWGGWGWGPRFLVPFVPYLILPLAATMERVLAQRRWLWLGVLLFVLALIGAVIQLTGVLVGPSMPAFNLDSPDLAFSPSSSPLAWSLAAWDRASLDVAWLRLGDRPLRTLSILLPSMLIIGLSAYLLSRSLRSSSRHSGSVLPTTASLVLLLLVSMWSLQSYSRYDQRYRMPPGIVEAFQFVWNQLQEGDILVIERNRLNVAPMITLHDGSHAQDPHIYRSRFFNRCLGDCPPFDETLRDEWTVRPDTDERVEELVGSHARIWFIMVDLVYDEKRVAEQALDEITFKQDCHWFSSTLRLCRYDNLLAKTSASFRSGLDTAIGDAIWLRAVEIGSNRAQSSESVRQLSAEPGEALLVHLIWEGRAPTTEDYKVSLQLVDSQGQLRQQIDRQPVDGLRPTTSWRVGDVISDRYSFVLPSDLEVGVYELNLVVYDPVSLRRLTAGSDDTIELSVVEIDQRNSKTQD